MKRSKPAKLVYVAGIVWRWGGCCSQDGASCCVGTARLRPTEYQMVTIVSTLTWTNAAQPRQETTHLSFELITLVNSVMRISFELITLVNSVMRISFELITLVNSVMRIFILFFIFYSHICKWVWSTAGHRAGNLEACCQLLSKWC